MNRDTGEAHLIKVVAVDDSGRIVNPLLAEGQVLGALTSTLADYALPRAVHIPTIITEFLETPSPFNPLGAKGIGEAGTVAAPAAIANAVMDALRPLGIRHIGLPLTPRKLWHAIQGEVN